MTAVSDIIFLCDIYAYKLHKNTHTQLPIFFWALTMAIILIIDILTIISACFLLLKRSRSLEDDEQEKFKVEKNWFWMHAANLVLMIVTFPFEVVSWQEKIYLSKNTSFIVDLIKMYTAINLCIVFVLRASVRSKINKDYSRIKEALSESIMNLNKILLRNNSSASANNVESDNIINVQNEQN
jgi:heme/copper-type cytochrome/quinol oxidase subunit 1